jgi:L-lactate dehydrogenase complex protein LldG
MPAMPKEVMLKRIREALATPAPQPFPESGEKTPVFPPSSTHLEVEFAENFTKLQGQFAYCMGWQELKQQVLLLLKQKQWSKVFCNDPKIRQLLALEWHNDLASCQASITDCELLVARTGTIVLTTSQSGGRTASVYAPVHICIATMRQLVYDVKDALEMMRAKYGESLPSFITFASGPSRTADIEKTLVTGVHGPKEVFCFLVEP